MSGTGCLHIKVFQLHSENANLCKYRIISYNYYVLYYIFHIVVEESKSVDMLVEFAAYQTEVIISITDVFLVGLKEFEIILAASPDVFIDSPASATVKILLT